MDFLSFLSLGLEKAKIKNTLCFFCIFLRIFFIFIHVYLCEYMPCVWLSMEAGRDPSRGISHKSLQAHLAGVAGFSAITVAARKSVSAWGLLQARCSLPRVISQGYRSEGLLSSQHTCQYLSSYRPAILPCHVGLLGSTAYFFSQ